MTDRQLVDVSAMIAAIVGAQRGRYNYFAEMETAEMSGMGPDHLALDEIGIYLEKKDISEGPEAVARSLYDYMTETVKNAPAGPEASSSLHASRQTAVPLKTPQPPACSSASALETGKTELIRAVLEGICYHLRWMLECQARKISVSDTIRFVGGGALSPVTSQILADITGHPIEVVESPQNVGSVGAAAVAAVGLA